MSKLRTLAVLLVVPALTLASCSSDKTDNAGKNDKAGTSTTAPGTTGTTAPTTDLAGKKRPDGPAAEVVKELSGGQGPALSDLTPPDLEGNGFVEHEFEVKGNAVSYKADGDLPADGTWKLAEDANADYRTRVVVRRPEKAADFNGTVVVEWLNVSGGLDANPDWTYLGDELLRGGYAWAGVSAQRIGVEGGPVAVPVPVAAGMAGQGLKKMVPERYGSLSHPGDAFAYDMYTQVGRAIRAGATGPGASTSLLGDLEPEVVLAAGESQSAFMLTSYANGVQPLTQEYDGFLIHSRGGGAGPLGTAGGSSDIASAIATKPTKIRTDLDAPVIMLQSESDVVGVLGYYPARQDDTDLIRLWEVAGTSHVDEYMLGPIADSMGCTGQINAGPLHFVAKAAIRGLDQWVRTGEAPPKAARMDVEEVGGKPAYKRSPDGIVLGGIRTPEVDVPVSVLSGVPTTDASVICLLLGSTKPLPPARIAELYPSKDSYEKAYGNSTDEAIAAGFVLKEDRKTMIADADPAAVAG